jgi:hypothetical protein
MRMTNTERVTLHRQRERMGQRPVNGWRTSTSCRCRTPDRSGGAVSLAAASSLAAQPAKKGRLKLDDGPLFGADCGVDGRTIGSSKGLTSR